MATAWHVSGQYYETCNCEFICMCVPGQMVNRPTKGNCQFAMAFQIERGKYAAVTLDGLGFIVLGLTPAEMGKGNWSVGLVIDVRASSEQRAAITAIASGAPGGPMAALSGMIGKFVGAESAAITFDRQGSSWSVKAASLVDMAATGAKGFGTEQDLQLSNTGHPANNTFTLARASRSHINAMGLRWDDVSGTNNGQFAPFSWKGE